MGHMNRDRKTMTRKIEALISSDQEYRSTNKKMIELEKIIKSKTEDKTVCIEYFDLACKIEEHIINLIVEYLHII